MNAVEAALAALAGCLDKMPLADTGNLLRAAVGPLDGATPPTAAVTANRARWVDTGRADGSGLLEAEALVVLPSPTGPVAGALSWRLFSDVRARINHEGGRTLGGAAIAWRLVSADTVPTPLGGRSQPSILLSVDIWLPI